jgi:hypothetical protein
MKTRQSRQQAVSQTHGTTKQPASAPLRAATHPTALIQGARANLSALTPTEFLQLQRTIGNRAVGRLLAPAAQRQSIRKTQSTTSGLPEPLKSGIESLRPSLRAPVTRPKATHCPPEPPVPTFAGHQPVAQARGHADSFEVNPRKLGLASSRGNPLPNATRDVTEAALGANFAGVRVHEGPQAQRIGALAFTTGTDIYFAPGQFQPETMPGQQLIGHELAHVVQQRAGRVRNPLGTGLAVVQDKALEAEADRLGQRAAAASKVPNEPGLQRRAPQAFARGAPNRYAAPPQSVQLFKLDGKQYNRKAKLKPLIDQMKQDPDFAGKETDVAYWLTQYVSIYGDKYTFTKDELKDYLYDDIIRQERSTKEHEDMGVQELLTTEAGFKRLRRARQSFPADGELHFYRTMDLAELRALLTDKDENPVTDEDQNAGGPTLPAQ